MNDKNLIQGLLVVAAILLTITACILVVLIAQAVIIS